MGAFFLAVVLAVGVTLGGARADRVQCGFDTVANVPKYIDPALQICGPNNNICPVASPCFCPTPDAAAPFGCSAVATSPSCVCYGSSKGDPLVSGFDGCSWYLHGQPDTVMNLVSEANHVVNTQLVPANLTDPHHASGEGTFHGAISMRYRDTVVTASATPEGNLTVFLGAKPVPFGEAREQSGLTVKVTEFYTWYGQVAEVVTPAFRFFIHAVQPYDTPTGWSRGHLDFSMTVSAADVNMHGLLGQTINRAGALCPGDFEFHGEGIEADYVMPHLESVDFTYGAFIGQTASVSRRLQAAKSVYVPAAITKTASSGALLGL